MKSICRMCKKDIVLNENKGYWEHLDFHPRHPAFPIDKIPTDIPMDDQIDLIFRRIKQLEEEVQKLSNEVQFLKTELKGL